MNARVVFSKKTQEKINKGLTKKERGELRWKKLEEANKDGRLSLCKTRKDVAALGGYTDGTAGNSWVHRLISNRHLQEVHVSGNGRFAEYAYFIHSKPNFLPFAGRYGADARKEPTKAIEPTKPTKTPSRKVGEKNKKVVETPKVEVPVVLNDEHTEPVVLSRAKLTIKTDIATVEIESVSAEIVEKVLEKVCVNTKM